MHVYFDLFLLFLLMICSFLEFQEMNPQELTDHTFSSPNLNPNPSMVSTTIGSPSSVCGKLRTNPFVPSETHHFFFFLICYVSFGEYNLLSISTNRFELSILICNIYNIIILT